MYDEFRPLNKFSSEEVTAQLTSEGLVFFRADSLAEIKALDLGEVFIHPDSDSFGITQITYRKDFVGERRAGFSMDGLFPHTDRSIMELPPEVLVFWCEQAALNGGDALLVDGLELHKRLRFSTDGLLEFLESGTAAVLGGDNLYRQTAIFAVTSENTRRLCYRNDHLLFANIEKAEMLRKFNRIILGCSKQLRLSSGCGYILQNTRWLHGRTPFSGLRICYRLNFCNTTFSSFAIS